MWKDEWWNKSTSFFKFGRNFINSVSTGRETSHIKYDGLRFTSHCLDNTQLEGNADRFCLFFVFVSLSLSTRTCISVVKDKKDKATWKTL